MINPSALFSSDNRMQPDNQLSDFTVPTRYWHALDDGRLQCDLCPRHCKLHNGQQGLCFVREARDNAIVMTSYGRSSGFCVDPIEKKPLHHFYPGSAVLSFGTAGCNLACKFCQNWDMSKSRENATLSSVAMPDQLAQACIQTGARSIAFTYNDPVIFHEYAIDVAQACHDVGVKTVAVTAGYVCDAPRAAFFRHMDAANIDLKAFNEKFYHEVCGAHLHNILDTLEYVKHGTNTWLEITTLLIPGENDSDAELEAMTRWIHDHLGQDVPLHFSAFHPDWKMRDKSHTPAATLQRARKIARANGLRYVYVGNVHDRDGGSTWCPHCDELLIERDWYRLGEYHIADGSCRHCTGEIAGHFSNEAGDWGRQRMPVRFVS